MTSLKDKYPNFKLVHFIEMYDTIISIEDYALNALIFEGKAYINSILREINELENRQETHLVINYMRLCAWTNENELSVTRVKKELTSIKNL